MWEGRDVCTKLQSHGTDWGGQAKPPKEEILVQSPRISRQRHMERREGHSRERGRREQRHGRGTQVWLILGEARVGCAGWKG